MLVGPEMTRRTPQFVLLPADGVDGEGVGVLVAGGDDGSGQREHATGLLRTRLLVDKVLQQAGLIVEHKEPGLNTTERTPDYKHNSLFKQPHFTRDN